MNISDFNFGAPSPVLAGNGWSGYGLAGSGASNPVASYLQAAPANSNISAGAGSVSGISGFGAPAMSGAAPSGGGGGGLGFNMDTGKLVLGGLQTIGNLWQAWEANKLAKEQFNFSKGFANTNLANQIQSYNTALTDKINARFSTEGKSPDQVAAYLNQNRLPAANIK